MKNLLSYIKEQFLFFKQKERSWQIGYVTLFVADLLAMKKFYTKTLGMDVLQEFNGMVLLGDSNSSTCLLKLIQYVPLTSQQKLAANMQYMGFQFSRRQDLGNFVNHLLLTEVTIRATEDDGYSEALYIKDPENNVIKIFWEKTSIEHVQQDVHQREGEELKLPLNHFLTLADKPYERIPAQTQLAQLHLSVVSLEESEQFYKSVFPFSATFDYLLHRKNLKLNEAHYTLALNTWKGILAKQEEQAFGLHLITFYAPTIKAIETVAQNLQNSQIDFTYDQGDLFFVDPNNFKIRVTLGS